LCVIRAGYAARQGMATAMGFGRRTRCPASVIPAQAGIHLDRAAKSENGFPLARE